MSLVINHNLMAENTARNLNNHYGNLSTSVERLSSGLRINSAADDAAGLAIRELMRADIATFNQGIRNANDAVSMIQTADGALQTIDEGLIRMKELAEQAATGTYDSVQRDMINEEYQQVALEIQRIANSTDFNGIKLLDGSLSGTHNGSGLTSTGEMKIHFGTANDSAEDYYYVNAQSAKIEALFDQDNTAIGSFHEGQMQFYEPSDEVSVNTYTTGTQRNSVIASMQNGNYVVTWQSSGQDGSGAGVYSQMFTPNGDKVGSEQIVNTTTLDSQSIPSTTALSNGGYVVTWTSSNQDDSGDGIYSQHFDSSGAKVGTETLVNTVTAGTQTFSDVTNIDGGYLVTWTTMDGVYGKTYGNNGQIIADEFPIRIPGSSAREPEAVQLADGNIAVSYFAQDGSNWGVFAQIITPQGTPVGAEQMVNTKTADLQNFQDICALDDGRFVIAWSDVDGGLSTLAPGNAKLQIMNADGTKYGSEITANNETIPITFNQAEPKLTQLKEGGFAITWLAPDDTINEEVFLQMYSNEGVPNGLNQTININDDRNQKIDDIHYLESGGFVVTYTDYDNVLSRIYTPVVSVLTQERAQKSLEAVQEAIVYKDKIRAHLGAMQNRLEATIGNLAIQAENLQASESRISDTDVGIEMTNLVRNQILTQSAVAMLGQANALPKMAQQLIGG